MTSKVQVCTNHSSSNGMLIDPVSLLHSFLCSVPSLHMQPHKEQPGTYWDSLKFKLSTFHILLAFLKPYRKLSGNFVSKNAPEGEETSPKAEHSFPMLRTTPVSVQTSLQSKGGMLVFTGVWGGKERGRQKGTGTKRTEEGSMSLHLGPALNNTPRVRMPYLYNKNPPKLLHSVSSPHAAISSCCLPLFPLPPAFSGQDHLSILSLLPVQHGAPWGLLAAAEVSGGSPNTNNNNHHLQSASRMQLL